MANDGTALAARPFHLKLDRDARNSIGYVLQEHDVSDHASVSLPMSDGHAECIRVANASCSVSMTKQDEMRRRILGLPEKLGLASKLASFWIRAATCKTPAELTLYKCEHQTVFGQVCEVGTHITPDVDLGLIVREERVLGAHDPFRWK